MEQMKGEIAMANAQQLIQVCIFMKRQYNQWNILLFFRKFLKNVLSNVLIPQAIVLTVNRR